MRMITVSAIGLALALPLTAASVPACADSGAVYTSHADQSGWQNNGARYGDQGRQDQVRRGDQRADSGPGAVREDHGRYGENRSDQDHGQLAQGDQNWRGGEQSWRDHASDQAHVDRTHNDQFHGQQAESDHARRGEEYSQRDRFDNRDLHGDRYANGERTDQGFGAQPYNHNGTGDRD